MAACKIDLSNQILQEAQRQGVDPGIALATARTESGVCQWRPDGSVVTSSAGAIGIFQLMPATAAGLGVDPYDVDQNIRGGITFLKQLFQKYGTWDQALAAYNFGPGNVDAGKSWPTETLNYVKAILGIGTVYNAGLNKIQSDSSNSPAASSADVLASVIPTSNPKIAIGAAIALGGLALGVYLYQD